MTIDTIFITRYVADHAEVVAWYENLFGTPPAAPVPNCREWQPRPGVIFQVINQPEKAGVTTFGFGVADLPGDRARLERAGVQEVQHFEVAGFDGLHCVEYADPEGVLTALLNTSGPAA